MAREFDERNMARSRERCAAMAEEADTGKRRLTERERRILDMWPRYEDGELVMVGDRVGHPVEKVGSITILESAFVLCDDAASSAQYERGQCVKRPVQSVLDADGVRIREGDTVWIIPALTDTPDEPHEVIGINRWGEVLLEFHTEGSTGLKGEYLTHARPDSWERLEEDAGEDPFRYCKTVGKRLDTFDNAEVFKSADIVRRAKKLAEVGE